jgi:hypothetical protein
MHPLVLTVLVLSAVIPLGLCLYIRRRFVAPGARPLALMMLAIGWWSVTAIGWGLATSLSPVASRSAHGS